MRLGDVATQPIRLADLDDEEPPPPALFGGGRSRGAGGGGSFAGPPSPEEEAIESVGHPLEPIFWAPGMRATGPFASAISGASSAGAAGALEDVAAGRNLLPKLPGNVAAGAALGPLASVLGAAARRTLSRAPKPAPAIKTAQPPMPPKQPFTGQSAQQQIEPAKEMFAEIQRDPAYLRRLRELGGGRVQTNQQTLAEALKDGPMPPEEIAAWTAERPINAAIQTRALLTKDALQQRWKKAVEAGDPETARMTSAALAQIEPGIQNLRATGGRATQAQAMFVQDRVTQEMEKLADMQAKGVPFDQMRQAALEAKQRLANEGLLGRIGAKAHEGIEALETYATAAKLTSPVTHAINSVSNALTFFVARPSEKLLKAGVLAAQGQPVEARAALQALYGTSAGFQNGLRRWGHTLMDAAVEPGKAEVARGLPLRGKARLLDPFRHLAAADAFWKGVLEDSELHQMAFASAAKEGLSGPAMAQRVTALVNDPPTAWRARAESIAKEFTFQEDPDKFISKVLGIRNLPFMRLFMPFIQTPYNLTKFHFQRSPLWVLSPRNIKGVVAGGEEQAEALARLTMGVGFAMGAWMTVARGEVTGEYPKDKATRELWEVEGRKPYSVRIGNRWLAYNRFQPLGMYLGQAAALDDAIKAGDEKGAGQVAARLAASGGKQILDMPFVSGMSSLLDAIQDPERSATSFAAQTLSGLIPNIARDIRYQTDPVMRETKQLGFAGRSINMIPGLSQTLPPRIDALGREILYDPNRLARASKVLSPSRENERTRTMREVMENKEKAERPPKLEPAEQAKFDAEMGQARARGIDIATSQPGYKNLPLDEQADAVQKAVDYQRKAVRNRWKAKKPPDTLTQPGGQR